MKALSLGLIKGILHFMEAHFTADMHMIGSIDQVLEEATLTWVQPRVLNKHQVIECFALAYYKKALASLCFSETIL